ncbi:hypothetical protein ACOMHN_047555 [Nucella lapillus]
MEAEKAVVGDSVPKDADSQDIPCAQEPPREQETKPVSQEVVHPEVVRFTRRGSPRGGPFHKKTNHYTVAVTGEGGQRTNHYTVAVTGEGGQRTNHYTVAVTGEGGQRTNHYTVAVTGEGGQRTNHYTVAVTGEGGATAGTQASL